MKTMKTKTMMMAILALFIGISFTSCEKIKGKGDTVTVTRTATGYSSIGLAMPATVYFTTADEYSLEIQGQQNIIDRIETRVKGSQLKIKLKNGVSIRNHEPIRVYVTAPAVNTLEISGSGDIYSDNTWTGQDLSIHISGSGNITISEIVADRFSASISGSGDMKVLAGTAGRVDLKISGSGNIEMHQVVAEEVWTRTSGSGDMYVQAQDLLDVTISGSGNIFYLGNPIINTHISGSGNIQRL